MVCHFVQNRNLLRECARWSRLSETRDMEAAKAFFQQTHEVADAPPERVFTDGHTSYPRAIKEELGTFVMLAATTGGWNIQPFL